MARVKMLPWQPDSFNTRKDETTGRWVAQTRYRDGAGESVMIKRQGRTKGAAEQAVRVAIREAENDWGAASRTSLLTVARLAAEWLDVIRPASVVIDPQTQSGSTPTAGLRMQSWLQYEQKLTTHVIPVLGDIPVETLTTPQCQRAIHALYDIEAGTGFRTAALTKQVLQQLLDHAVQQGYRTDNPVRSISKIPRKREKPKIMTPTTVRRVHAAVTERQVEPGVGGPKPTSRLADAVVLIAATGMRVREVLAIRWEDVDLSSTPPTVTVSGTLVEGRYFYRQDFPKSEDSERIYPITVPWASCMLLRRSANAEATRRGAVFGTRNGTFWRPSNFRKDFARALKAAGITEAVTAHTFRRTVASQRAEWFNGPSASIQLGHSSPEVTRRSYIVRPKLIPDFGEGLANLAPELS